MCHSPWIFCCHHCRLSPGAQILNCTYLQFHSLTTLSQLLIATQRDLSYLHFPGHSMDWKIPRGMACSLDQRILCSIQVSETKAKSVRYDVTTRIAGSHPALVIVKSWSSSLPWTEMDRPIWHLCFQKFLHLNFFSTIALFLLIAYSSQNKLLFSALSLTSTNRVHVFYELLFL